MFKIKFFAIGFMLLVPCLNIYAMENKDILKSTDLNSKENLSINNKSEIDKIAEEIDIKSLDFYDIENIRNKLTNYKISIKNSSTYNKNKEKISDLYLKLFEKLIFELKTKKIEDKNECEIDCYIKEIKICQRDLINLREETKDCEIKNKINRLIEEFYDINLNLIEIYSNKLKFKTDIMAPTTILNYLYNHKSYLENINEKEINKHRIDETKEKVLNAVYEIAKKYYAEYVIDNIMMHKHINKPWIIYHLDLLNTIKEDCSIFVEKETDFGKLHYAIKELNALKNKFK